VSIKKSNIKIEVAVNEKNIPVKIEWDASDSANEGMKEAKAFILSIFDQENKDTLRIDLWTREMQVIEMDRFVYQTLRTMADTYFKATNNHRMAQEMQRFAVFFGEETEILKKK